MCPRYCQHKMFQSEKLLTPSISDTITAFKVFATCAEIVLLKPIGPETDMENLLKRFEAT